MRKMILPAVLAATAVATPALAVPVDWTINATFSDGGTITGTWTYDNAVPGGLMTNINVTTSGGARPSVTYDTRLSGGTNGFVLATAGAAGPDYPCLIVGFNLGMGDEGGTLNIIRDVEGDAPDPACAGAFVSTRALTGGTATGVVAGPPAIPTMTEWAMIGLTTLLAAAGGLFVARRRRIA